MTILQGFGRAGFHSVGAIHELPLQSGNLIPASVQGSVGNG